jgi:hypothetical protein
MHVFICVDAVATTSPVRATPPFALVLFLDAIVRARKEWMLYERRDIMRLLSTAREAGTVGLLFRTDEACGVMDKDCCSAAILRRGHYFPAMHGLAEPSRVW